MRQKFGDGEAGNIHYMADSDLFSVVSAPQGVIDVMAEILNIQGNS
jgi:hypothetical protein